LFIDGVLLEGGLSMRSASDRCYDIIKKQETFQSKPYFCPAGKLTIGYGHVILKHEKFTEINEHQADELLARDCRIAENAVNNASIKLNQNQFDALVSLVFNIGVHNFLTSTIRKKLINQDWHEAANQFDRWVHCKGKVLPGLETRREAEKQLFLETI